jgi:hypothetical protein
VRLTCFEVCLFIIIIIIIIIKFPFSPEGVSSVFFGFFFPGEFSPFGDFKKKTSPNILKHRHVSTHCSRN